MTTGMYYDIAKYVATNIIDVDFNWEYKDGDLEIDLHVKIPIASLFSTPPKEKPKSLRR